MRLEGERVHPAIPHRSKGEPRPRHHRTARPLIFKGYSLMPLGLEEEELTIAICLDDEEAVPGKDAGETVEEIGLGYESRPLPEDLWVVGMDPTA